MLLMHITSGNMEKYSIYLNNNSKVESLFMNNSRYNPFHIIVYLSDSRLYNTLVLRNLIMFDTLKPNGGNLNIVQGVGNFVNVALYGGAIEKFVQ